MIHGLTLATASAEEVKLIREQMQEMVDRASALTGVQYGWVSLTYCDAQVLAPLE